MDKNVIISMIPIMPLFLELLFCAVLVFYAAAQLTKQADVLAEKLNLSRTWIGVVLLATITSLPELSNSLSSVIFLKEPDLGVGNLVGACLMNLLLIAFLDYLHKDKPIFSKLDLGQVLSASFAILLLALTILGIFSASQINAKLITFLIFLAYLAGQRLIFVFEKGKIFEPQKLYEKEQLASALAGILCLAIVIAGVIKKTERKLFLQLSWNSWLIVLIALSSWYFLFMIRKV